MSEFKNSGEFATTWVGGLGLIQGEEIVRCRDCIYYKQDPDPIDPGWPMMCERTGDDMVEPYGYCAWGERRERESAEVWNQWSADDVTCSEES